MTVDREDVPLSARRWREVHRALRYPVRLGNQLFPVGTLVKLPRVTDQSVQIAWPGIEENPNSTFVAVQFPLRNHVTIVKSSQLVEVPYPPHCSWALVVDRYIETVDIDPALPWNAVR